MLKHRGPPAHYRPDDPIATSEVNGTMAVCYETGIHAMNNHLLCKICKIQNHAKQICIIIDVVCIKCVICVMTDVVSMPCMIWVPSQPRRPLFGVMKKIQMKCANTV